MQRFFEGVVLLYRQNDRMEARGNLAKICEYLKGELCCDIEGCNM